ncbi:MAG: sigma-70 family RNA polymerase sigma factor [Armatimonadota bacterium]
MMSVNTQEWTSESVQNCLDGYSELFFLYNTSFVGSTWSHGSTLNNPPETTPSRTQLLMIKWDLEKALMELSDGQRRLFRLRYSAGMTHEQLALCMGCSRRHISTMLRRMSQLLLKTLSNG